MIREGTSSESRASTNVTQIIIGKPLEGFWPRLFGRRTLVDK